MMALSNPHFATAEQQIIGRFKSMVLLCIYCNNQNPMTPSVVDLDYRASGPFATAFCICPDCRNKFVVNIQDLGKVRK